MTLKKWLLFIIIFAISLTSILSLLIYFQAKAPFKNANETAESYVLKNNLLSEVDNSYMYNSVNTFHTVIGKTSEGEQKAFFVPEEKTEKVIQEINLKDGISESEAIQLALKDEQESDLLHAKLGVEEVGPVWEITYVNKDNKLNYVYILFNNGDWWKRISNL